MLLKSIKALIFTIIFASFFLTWTTSFAEETCKEIATGYVENVDILCDGTTSEMPVKCFYTIKTTHGTDKEKSIACAGAVSYAPVKCYYHARASNLDSAILCSGVTESNWEERVSCFNKYKGTNWKSVKACAKKGLKYLDKLTWEDQ